MQGVHFRSLCPRRDLVNDQHRAVVRILGYWARCFPSAYDVAMPARSGTRSQRVGGRSRSWGRGKWTTRELVTALLIGPAVGMVVVTGLVYASGWLRP